MTDDAWYDSSVLEAVSWRLASELCRRHPTTTRLRRTHPGGGQYDCLQIESSVGAAGTISLNRAGSIHVLERFDGRAIDWNPVGWDEYIRADPRQFLDSLERSAGLPTPTSLAASTPRTLTLRILATFAVLGLKSVHPIHIESGMTDTSGYGGGPNRDAFVQFPSIPVDLLEAKIDDIDGAAESRFWFVVRDDVPVLAAEQALGLAWTQHHAVAWNLMDIYEECRRNLLITTFKLLRRIDSI